MTQEFVYIGRGACGCLIAAAVDYGDKRTAANVADITQTAKLLHGQEHQVHADAGYTGVAKRAEIVALQGRMDARKSRVLFVFNLMALLGTAGLAWGLYTQVVVIRHHWGRVRGLG